MTREELFPPRTLADALTYYADADFKNAISTAEAEAKIEVAKEIAKRMKKNGIPFDCISGVTSVPIIVIEIL